MQLTALHPRFDTLHKKYGSKNFVSIYGAGQTHSPKVCFVFMNPTGRNVSAVHFWKGLRAPWLGTKNIWKLLSSVGVISKDLNKEIQSMKPADWNVEFSGKVYGEIKKNNYFITNLAKCTQDDAAALHDSIFEEYLDLMKEEIYLLNPDKVITFGNQVSSILLGQNIVVSKSRKKSFALEVKDREYDVYPVFYPVGQGMRNMPKAIADIKHILNK